MKHVVYSLTLQVRGQIESKRRVSEVSEYFVGPYIFGD